MDKVTGSGEDWLRDGLDLVGADAVLWVTGVDYMAGWREARQAADRLNGALLGAGIELSEVQAAASTDAEGRGVVRLAGWPGAVMQLADVLEAVDGRAGGGA